MRNKEVTARELSFLAAQAGNFVNPSLNAVVEFYDERMDNPDSGADSKGDFYGVSFLVKDLALMEAGKRMEAGSRLCEGMISPVDSELMRRYKRAGFNNIGRTNCPEFGFSCATESSLERELITPGIQKNLLEDPVAGRPRPWPRVLSQQHMRVMRGAPFVVQRLVVVSLV